jgi:hypothetical protein
MIVLGEPSTFSMRQLPEIACEPGGPAETRHSSLFVTVAIGCVWLTSSIAPLPSGDTANFSVKVGLPLWLADFSTVRSSMMATLRGLRPHPAAGKRNDSAARGMLFMGLIPVGEDGVPHVRHRSGTTPAWSLQTGIVAADRQCG